MSTPDFFAKNLNLSSFSHHYQKKFKLESYILWQNFFGGRSKEMCPWQKICAKKVSFSFKEKPWL